MVTPCACTRCRGKHSLVLPGSWRERGMSWILASKQPIGNTNAYLYFGRYSVRLRREQISIQKFTLACVNVKNVKLVLCLIPSKIFIVKSTLYERAPPLRWVFKHPTWTNDFAQLEPIALADYDVKRSKHSKCWVDLLNGTRLHLCLLAESSIAAQRCHYAAFIMKI